MADALAQATDVPEPVPEPSRRARGRSRSTTRPTASTILDTFGRCPRTVGCASVATPAAEPPPVAAADRRRRDREQGRRASTATSPTCSNSNPEPDEVVENLYMRTVCRPPTAEELSHWSAELKQADVAPRGGRGPVLGAAELAGIRVQSLIVIGRPDRPDREPVPCPSDAPIPDACRGPSRRDLLRAGLLGAPSGSASTTCSASGASAAARRAKRSRRRSRTASSIWLAGGPSHIDTFDPKPDAPADVRGEFKPIDTAVPGLQDQRGLPEAREGHGPGDPDPERDLARGRPRPRRAPPADRLPAEPGAGLPELRQRRREDPRDEPRAPCRPTSRCPTPRSSRRAAT